MKKKARRIRKELLRKFRTDDLNKFYDDADKFAESFIETYKVDESSIEEFAEFIKSNDFSEYGSVTIDTINYDPGISPNNWVGKYAGYTSKEMEQLALSIALRLKQLEGEDEE